MAELNELIELLRLATAELRVKRTHAREVQAEVYAASDRVDALQHDLDRAVAKLVDPSTAVISGFPHG